MAGAGPALGYEILGAVKVKDGLFIGDELAAQDLEFVVSNKVTRVVNCCGRQVPNHWESIGVDYQTYYWVDADMQVILDQRDVVANEVFRFVEMALASAESVLFHSVRGQSRSCCVLSAYMMKKYSWGLRKTMEFLSFRRPDMSLKPAFIQQLSGYERRLMAQSKFPLSLDWTDADFSRLECEDLMLRNTYINSQMGPLAEFQFGDAAHIDRPRRLRWQDGDSGDKLRLEKPAGADRHNACYGFESGQKPIRCILKRNEIPEVHHPPLAVGTSVGTSTAAPQEPPEVVPTAWAADAEAIGSDTFPPRPRASTGNSGSLTNSTKTASSGKQQFQGRSASPAIQGGSSATMMQHRGPATHIRDSLSISSSRRGDSVEPSRRTPTPSRDPSPKTGQGRLASPNSHRGESPLRYPSRGSRTGSGTSTPTGGGGVLSSGRGSASALGGPISTGQMQVGSGMPRAVSAGSGSSTGMGAFRAGGPVRARAEVLGPDASANSSSMRRCSQRGPSTSIAGAVRSGSRPASPLTQRVPSVSSRPASPLIQRASSTSRPASPLGSTQRASSSSRPASPKNARPPGAPQPQNRPPMPRMGSGGYPPTRQSRSSHMRRAPSPTPAFNRNPSPSTPRWRT